MDDFSKEQGLSDDQVSVMQQAARAAIAYRETLHDAPARPPLGLEDMAARFMGELAEGGMPERAVIDHIVEASEGGLHKMAAPTFFGYVLGGSHPVGVAADFLVSAWGQNAGSAFETPAIAAMERGGLQLGD